MFGVRLQQPEDEPGPPNTGPSLLNIIPYSYVMLRVLDVLLDREIDRDDEDGVEEFTCTFSSRAI